MLNEDVIDLYSRIEVGTRVVVLPTRRDEASSAARSTSLGRTASSAPDRIPMTTVAWPPSGRGIF